MKSIEVYFYTKQNCPLCDQAEDALQSLATEYPLIINKLDIYEDDALLEKYEIRIPVIEVSGIVIAEGVVTETMVREQLQKLLFKT